MNLGDLNEKQKALYDGATDEGKALLAQRWGLGGAVASVPTPTPTPTGEAFRLLNHRPSVELDPNAPETTWGEAATKAAVAGVPILAGAALGGPAGAALTKGMPYAARLVPEAVSELAPEALAAYRAARRARWLGEGLGMFAGSEATDRTLRAVGGQPQPTLAQTGVNLATSLGAGPVGEKLILPAYSKVNKLTLGGLSHAFGPAARAWEQKVGTEPLAQKLGTEVPLMSEKVQQYATAAERETAGATASAAEKSQAAQATAAAKSAAAMEKAQQNTEKLTNSVNDRLNNLHRSVAESADKAYREAIPGALDTAKKKTLEAANKDKISELTSVFKPDEERGFALASAGAGTPEGVEASQTTVGKLKELYRRKQSQMSGMFKGALEGKYDEKYTPKEIKSAAEQVAAELNATDVQGFKIDPELRSVAEEVIGYGGAAAKEIDPLAAERARMAKGAPAGNLAPGGPPRNIIDDRPDPKAQLRAALGGGGPELDLRGSRLMKQRLSKWHKSPNENDQHIAQVISDAMDDLESRFIPAETRALYADHARNWRGPNSSMRRKLFRATRPQDAKDVVNGRFLAPLLEHATPEDVSAVRGYVSGLTGTGELKLADVPRMIGDEKLMAKVFDGEAARKISSWGFLDEKVNDLGRLAERRPEYAQFYQNQATAGVDEVLSSWAKDTKKVVLRELAKMGPTAASLMRDISRRSDQEVANFYLEHMTQPGFAQSVLDEPIRMLEARAAAVGVSAQEKAAATAAKAQLEAQRAADLAQETAARQTKDKVVSTLKSLGPAGEKRLLQIVEDSPEAFAAHAQEIGSPGFREALIAEAKKQIPIGTYAKSIKWGTRFYDGMRIQALLGLGMYQVAQGHMPSPLVAAPILTLTGDAIVRGVRHAVVRGMESNAMQKMFTMAENPSVQKWMQYAAHTAGRAGGAGALRILALGGQTAMSALREPAPPQPLPAPVMQAQQGPLPVPGGAPPQPPTDPVRQEFAIHQMDMPKFTSFHVGGQQVTDPAAVGRYQKAVETAARAKVGQLAQSPEYRQASPQAQRMLLRAALRGARQIALGSMRAELPTLMAKRQGEPEGEAPDPMQ